VTEATETCERSLGRLGPPARGIASEFRGAADWSDQIEIELLA
jgi:hypothetical protein